MKFKIDTTLKRIYDIDYILFGCSSDHGAIFTVKCDGRKVYFEVEYDRLFKELYENAYSSIKDIDGFYISDMVNYLIERQNEYILNKIVLALNNSNCKVLKLEAHED